MVSQTPSSYPQGGCNFNHFSAANAGAAIKATAGILFGLSVNTGATSGTVTLYDGASTGGTVIGVFQAAAAAPNPVPSVGIAFKTGLFIVITGAPDITVSWF